MRHPRSVSVTYYEWDVAKWRASETREQLTPEGRYIFREIIDQCYVAGDIPKDLELLSRMVGCTEEQMRRTWPIISRHFKPLRRDKTHLAFELATVWRTNFFKYVSQQRRGGTQSAINRGHGKPREISEIGNGGLSLSKRIESNVIEMNRNESNEEKDTSSPPDPPAAESTNGNGLPPLEIVRRRLTQYANELCKLGWMPPDDSICENTLAAVGGNIEVLDARLVKLWKERQARPTKSYAWFPAVLRRPM